MERQRRLLGARQAARGGEQNRVQELGEELVVRVDGKPPRGQAMVDDRLKICAHATHLLPFGALEGFGAAGVDEIGKKGGPGMAA